MIFLMVADCLQCHTQETLASLAAAGFCGPAPRLSTPT